MELNFRWSFNLDSQIKVTQETVDLMKRPVMQCILAHSAILFLHRLKQTSWTIKRQTLLGSDSL